MCVLMMHALTLFSPPSCPPLDILLYFLEVDDVYGVDGRWTMDLESKLLPWRPHVIVTGQSFYSIDSATGKIAAQRDTWDSVSDNNYVSVEGLAYIIRSLTDPKVS